MFLDAAKSHINFNQATVSPDNIDWDYDDAYNYDTDVQMNPEDFDWYEGIFLLENIGDADFYDHLVWWIEREFDFKSPTDTDPESWGAIWRMLNDGGDIHTPVQIALAYQPHYEEERSFIVDGWHRVALYIKAGRTEIPAIIGVPRTKG